ncbi:MAG: hypothetical protein CM1200mP3_08600 [Chloroflexota bacterium]|nr:MAG: hypothetical protein CM1200mP3_08600 [Chloroflexota bacterium]
MFVKDLRNSSLSDDDIYKGCTIDEKIETSVVSDDNTVYIYARDHSVRALSLGKYGNPDEKWDFSRTLPTKTQRNSQGRENGIMIADMVQGKNNWNS